MERVAADARPDFVCQLRAGPAMGGRGRDQRDAHLADELHFLPVVVAASQQRHLPGIDLTQLQASPLDVSGSFVTFAIYAPQNVGKLEAAFKEEVARALKDGFAEQEVKEAKSGYLQSRQVSRAQDASLARTLAQDLFIKRTLEWDAAIEKKIAALTPGEIVEAMRRRIDPSKITIVKAGDFAKAGAAPAK